MYNKILVPTDGSEHAVRAEEEAIYIAEKTGAELIGLSTVENNFVNGLPLNDEVYELNNLLKENTKNNVDKFEELVPADPRSISPVNGIILVDKSVSRQEVCKSYSSDSTSSHNL